jgi:cytoskeletal protein CcmA (bactofilin family)
MSGPDGQLSKDIGNEASLNHSAGSGESTDFPDTLKYFDAWLESVQPQLASEGNPVPANQSFPAPEHFPGPSLGPGEFRFEGILRVDGYITGMVRSYTGTLVVTETCEVDTDLFVAVAIIDGLVRGDIKATERVELGSSGRVIGNIETPSLTVQPGALFEGRCHFVPALNVVNQPAPQLPTEPPRLSVVRSREFTAAPHEEETEPLVAAAGR